MRKKKWEKYKQYVQLFYEMIESPAWQDLSCGAVWWYIELKHQSYGANERHLILPYSAVRHKIKSPTTIRKAIKELVSHGFVDEVEKSYLKHKPNIYGISQRWRDWPKDGVKGEANPKRRNFGAPWGGVIDRGT